MILNRTDNPINREGRNKLNENWETLERTYKKVVDDSSEAIDIANQANNTSDYVQHQLDTVISESGDANPEVIQARANFVNLRARLDEEKAQITTQLAQTAQQTARLDVEKATKTYVDQKTQAANMQWKMSFATKAKLEETYPTGDTLNHVVLADGFIYTWFNNAWTSTQITANAQKLADNTVSPHKTTFVIGSKNLFNKNDVVVGRNTATGLDVAQTEWRTTNNIAVTAGATIKRSHNAIVVEYDANGNYIALAGSNTTPLVLRQNTATIKISVQLENINRLQVEYGSVTTEYKDYNTIEIPHLKTNYIDIDNNAKKMKSFIPVKEYPDQLIKYSFDINTATTTNCIVEADYGFTWKDNPYSAKMTCSEPVTMSLVQTIDPVDLIGVQAVDILFYVDDPTTIDTAQVGLGTISSTPTTINWNRPTRSIRKGWNLFRAKSNEGGLDNWQTCHRIRATFVTTAPTSVFVALVVLEKTEKAKLLFVEDGGYIEFLERGYNDLKSRGVPTTWALNPGRLGVGRVISEEQVDELALDYMSAFSFHSWASEVHSTMTVEEVADNAIKCVRWLRKKGLTEDAIYRAAITQNNCPEHEILQQIVEAYSSPDGSSAYEIFPFHQPYGTPRITLHGATTERIDEHFEVLRKTRQLMIAYTHGIGESSTGQGQLVGDMTQENWEYFLTKLDAALSEGWLEGVTYEQLRRRYRTDLIDVI